MWNANKSHRSDLDWLDSRDCSLVFEFFWCKKQKWKFSTSVDHSLQHAFESCIIAKQVTIEVSYKNITSLNAWYQIRVQSWNPDIRHHLGRFLNLRGMWKP